MSENIQPAVGQMDMFEQRLAKIREYQEAGVNPFGGAFPAQNLLKSSVPGNFPPKAAISPARPPSLPAE